MPNIIDSTGLTIQTIQEIIDEILNGTSEFPGMYAIYGPDINVDPNSPDGQMVNIVAQAKADVLELGQQVYNSFDPDKAVGVALNARCAINGVTRNPGTFTQQVVTVTVAQALTLAGLDTAPTAPFTISDSSGNQYALVATQVFVAAGSMDLVFQAVLLGPVSSLPNTITTQVTIQAGVTSVNNTAGPSAVGLTEETDYALRIRRQKSVSLPSRGFIDGLVAALIDTKDVEQAIVYENDTNVTDANGIPGHSIWALVLGGSNTDIADAIYVERPAGVGQKGGITVPVLQADGTYFAVQFDRPTNQLLYISFNVAAIGSGAVDPTYIRQQLLALLTYDIAQPADTTTIVSLIRAISPSASVSAEGVSSDGVTYVSLLNTAAINNIWSLDPSRIIINGLPG